MENTGIRITLKEEVDDAGQKGYRIMNIMALSRSELPDLYLDNMKRATAVLQNKNALHLIKEEKTVCLDNFTRLHVNRFYLKNTIVMAMDLMREAGQHLAEVNAELTQSRATWHKQVIFVDGVKQDKKKAQRQKNIEKANLASMLRVHEICGLLPK